MKLKNDEELTAFVKDADMVLVGIRSEEHTSELQSR